MEVSDVSNSVELKEEDVILNNILAVSVLSETLKTTLGPKGFDKMLRDSYNQVAITDNGAAILAIANIQHPIAKMVVNLAKIHERDFGDGTTTLVVLVGELLKRAGDLMQKGLMPATIISGYIKAQKKALEILDELALEVRKEDIFNIAYSTLRGKLSDDDAKHLAKIATEAIIRAKRKENILISYRPGGKIKDTVLIDGIFIDLGKRVHPSMPKKVKNARILLVDREISTYIPKGTKFVMNDPRSMRALMEYKHRLFYTVASIIKRAGANVVLCEKNIEELAMFYFARFGIMAVRDVEKPVLKLLEKATKGRIVSNVKDVNPSVLGYAELIEESKIGLEEIMYVTGCLNKDVVSILVRGGTEVTAMEIERKMRDLIIMLERVYKSKKVLAGGGACEIELAEKLRKFAKTIPNKEQLAVEAFADALETIPKAIAMNAGMNVIDALINLRYEHSRGNIYHGLDVNDKKVKNTYEAGIIDNYVSKRQIIRAATELATAILKVDSIIAKKPKAKKKPAERKKQVFKEGKIDLTEAVRESRQVLKQIEKMNL